MMHSVERRFIAIVLMAMMVVVAPVTALFLSISASRIDRDLRQNAEMLVEASAQALAKPLWDYDSEAADRLADFLVNDSRIVAVRVYDASGTTVAEAPEIVPALDGAARIGRDITYAARDDAHPVGSIEVWVARSGPFTRFGADEVSMIVILVIASSTAFAAAIVGNRVIVVRPLKRLTAAIEATRRLGSRHHVDWVSADEMGTLAQNFNEMQTRLENEETQLKIAHARATDIYNRTPAMLFSTDAGGRITAVSDYWLRATGYRREAVIGRAFPDFIAPDWHEAYHARVTCPTAVNAAITEVTVPFLKADGETMVVLILETRDQARPGEEAPTLSVMTDVTALKQAENRNHVQAVTDHLTGLLNRQGFEAALDTAIRDADLRGEPLACIFIDLDRFKWINDNFGHTCGDAVLCETVSRIRGAVRRDDIVARLGGDEFAILVAAADAGALSRAIGERICGGLREPVTVEGTDLHVSASVGIALYPDHAANASELLLKSDMAMYARKHDGKNGTQIFDSSMLDAARERHEIEQQIDAALKGNWFEAYLQPIVSLRDGQIAGFEALMRLNHPVKGVLPPAKIVGIAEETGSIGRIGDVILDKAIGHLARISTLSGTETTYLAVNLSPPQFEQSLPSRLASLLLRHNVTPARIVIEITEALLMLDNPDVHAVLDQLSDFGCRIALDDFGTGYSSLSYLNRFPVDIVKIDQSFTRSLSDGTADVRKKSRMLIKGIRTISHQMGCTVVAEGIETEEQWQMLNRLGIDHGQGYLFSRPLHIDAMMRLLENDSEAKVNIRA
ncbi:putative bifunctional diguanylate cyclase/phosphodiesterase [Ensifer soli]|uniref:putative bifunctional diguanylate cyclase/phosphodiesterase n=1 Tax=Ciceribacter sp. sgz301302 TaxID=3342379 RepID=UPI0035BB5A56